MISCPSGTTIRIWIISIGLADGLSAGVAAAPLSVHTFGSSFFVDRTPTQAAWSEGDRRHLGTTQLRDGTDELQRRVVGKAAALRLIVPP